MSRNIDESTPGLLYSPPSPPLHTIILVIGSPCTILHYIQLSCLLGAPVLSSTTYNYHVYWEPLYSHPLHTIIMFIGSPCTPLRYIQLSCLLRELLYYPPLHTIIMFIGSSCTILHYIQLSCFIGSSCIPSTTYNYHVYWEPLSKYTLQLYEVYE